MVVQFPQLGEKLDRMYSTHRRIATGVEELIKLFGILIPCPDWDKHRCGDCGWFDLPTGLTPLTVEDNFVAACMRITAGKCRYADQQACPAIIPRPIPEKGEDGG